eukprot:PLAT9817.1.p1 GENE.PLAT9817.1~~PLAT9817.1.p1  ORF type:complete len:311 (+),score=109.75 PLAT9817.1:288-1220(+)
MQLRPVRFTCDSLRRHERLAILLVPTLALAALISSARLLRLASDNTQLLWWAPWVLACYVFPALHHSSRLELEDGRLTVTELRLHGCLRWRRTTVALPSVCGAQLRLEQHPVSSLCFPVLSIVLCCDDGRLLPLEGQVFHFHSRSRSLRVARMRSFVRRFNAHLESIGIAVTALPYLDVRDSGSSKPASRGQAGEATAALVEEGAAGALPAASSPLPAGASRRAGSAMTASGAAVAGSFGSTADAKAVPSSSAAERAVRARSWPHVVAMNESELHALLPERGLGRRRDSMPSATGCLRSEGSLVGRAIAV